MTEYFTMSSAPNSSMNESASNFTDESGRSFSSPLYVQAGNVSPGFHHNGAYQGHHNMHGSFNVPNMDGAPLAGMQLSPERHLAGHFGSTNLPNVLSQISHGSSYGHPRVSNREGMNVIGSDVCNSSTNVVVGSVPGVLPTSSTISNVVVFQELGYHLY